MNNDVQAKAARLSGGKFSALIEGYRQDSRVQTALQVAFLIIMGALSALLKRIEPSLGISGSSAILWLGPIVLSRMLVTRKGAGTLVGVAVALWGLPIGLNNGLMHNVFLYGGAGLVLDIISGMPFISIHNPLGAILCGIFAHLAKFGVIVGYAAVSPVIKHFELWGMANAFGLHVAFGAAAGLAAWIFYQAIQMSRRSKA